MIVTAQDEMLVGAGLTLAGAATIFYRRKQLNAFKLAYFLAWPTLGSAVIVACMPERAAFEEELRKEHHLDSDSKRESQALARLQMEKLRAIAAGEDSTTRQ
ncbi:hypothetical protein ACKKBG_A18015 [Auxenochlorella protothecoides x Auxenochlorella symbiontica]